MLHQKKQSKRKKKILIGFFLLVLVAAGINIAHYAGFFTDLEYNALKKNSPIEAAPLDMETIDCDVLVVGGGAGGSMAAIQSARNNAKTCLIEETTWLGGMVTAAGVSSFDGNDWNYTGLVKEFVDKIKNEYENPEETAKCLAPFCFEPEIGRKILHKMADEEENLLIFFQNKLKAVVKKENRINGVIATDLSGKERYFKAKVTIDATELGDVLYLGDIPFDLGADPKSTEPHARRIDCVQPITVVAILQDKGREVAPISKPKNYDRAKYVCTIPNPSCPDSNTKFENWDFLVKYGSFPNNKVMINVPSHSYGNDSAVDRPEFDPLKRSEVIELAKQNTLGLVYFFQTELGKNNYELFNEFGTEDKLSVIPYIRESRRLKGVKRLKEEDVIVDQKTGETRFWEDSIAVGDYPLDIHSCERGGADEFIPLPPFQVPYGALIPEKIDGFISAEKNISVTHIANGRSRLQPIVMAIGQAAGMAASLAAKNNIEPREVNIKELQQLLLNSGSRVNFFYDLYPYHWAFVPISILSQEKVINGYGKNLFGMMNPLKRAELAALLVRTFGPAKKQISAKMVFKDLKQKNLWYKDYAEKLSDELIKKSFGNGNFAAEKEITRGEAAEWIVAHKEWNLEVDKLATKFEDLDNKNPYKKAMEILVTRGILTGANNKIYPGKVLTREEMATIIYRLKNLPDNQ